MVAGTGAGRRQRIAFDATPLNAPEPDLDARIGWLLSMSRLHHQDDTFCDGGRFVTALSAAGFPASRSTISRWEAGLITVSREAMTGYEHVLGLEPGRITSTAGYLRAERQTGAAKVGRPAADPGTDGSASRFDELVDRASAGTARAGEWDELGWRLAAAPSVYLPAAVWETLAREIVTLLPRSVSVAYRQLSAAAMSMATIPRVQEHLCGAIADYLADPDVQVIANPLVLLDHLPTRRAARLVLDVVAQPERSVVFKTGVWLARRKMNRGELSADEQSELEMLVLRTWRSDPDTASEHLAELIADLPSGMRSTLVDAAARAGRPKLGYVVEHGEDVVAPKAANFSRRVADAARAGAPQEPTYHDDRMLARLVRESLFHRDTDRRHHASLLLSASPFASSLADELLRRIADSHPEWLRARLATLMRYVCNDSHRMRLLPLITDRTSGVSIPVAQSIGHLSFSETSDLATRQALQPEWSEVERAKLYALGMTASPAIESLGRSRTAPEWQRAAARWWQAMGPAVTG